MSACCREQAYVTFNLLGDFIFTDIISVFYCWWVDKTSFSTIFPRYLVLLEKSCFLISYFLLAAEWRTALCWPTVFHFPFVTGGHPPVRVIVADLLFLRLWLTGVKSGLASAIVTVVVKETKSPVPLPWGNRTASCGQRCCRTSGRIRSSPTTSCRSGTRYADGVQKMWRDVKREHWEGTKIF